MTATPPDAPKPGLSLDERAKAMADEMVAQGYYPEAALIREQAGVIERQVYTLRRIADGNPLHPYVLIARAALNGEKP